jgi:hypothetical protein
MHTSMTAFSRMSDEYESGIAKPDIIDSQKRFTIKQDRKFISPQEKFV